MAVMMQLIMPSSQWMSLASSVAAGWNPIRPDSGLPTSPAAASCARARPVTSIAAEAAARPERSFIPRMSRSCSLSPTRTGRRDSAGGIPLCPAPVKPY